MSDSLPVYDEHVPEPPGDYPVEGPAPFDDPSALRAAYAEIADAEPDDEPDDEGRKSQKDRLADLAVELFDLVTDATGTPFAVPKDGPRIARPLRGGRKSLRAELAALYRSRYKAVPSSNALADSLMVLEGIAGDSDPVDIHLRVARRADTEIVVDRGDADGGVIVITASGWVPMRRSPVLFRRTELINPLPLPALDGDLDLLRELVNVADEDWPLIVGFMVAALFPGVPCPILAPRGEQGTGKTTLAKMIVGVVDPSAAPVRPAPRDVEHWAVTASAGWLIALDNLSSIRDWLSDALCRAVTGDALPRRRLYSDDAVSVVTVQRPLILTSIELGQLHGDLAERLLPVTLQRISDQDRREETALWTEYEKRLPRIVGGLYDLTSKVLAELPHTRPERLPRMADFGRLLAALDKVTGWDASTRYEQVAGDAFQTVIDGDLVASKIVEMVAARGDIEGTPTEIYESLNGTFPDGRRPKGWPQSPHALSMQLTRAAVALRHRGIEIERRSTNGKRKIKITADPASLASLIPENRSTARVSAVTHPSDAPVTQVTQSDAPVTHPKQPASLPKTAQPQGFPAESDASDALSHHTFTPTLCSVCDRPGDLEVIRGELMHRRCRPAGWLDPEEIAP